MALVLILLILSIAIGICFARLFSVVAVILIAPILGAATATILNAAGFSIIPNVIASLVAIGALQLAYLFTAMGLVSVARPKEKAALRSSDVASRSSDSSQRC